MRKILFSLLLLTATFVSAQEQEEEKETVGSIVVRLDKVECTDPVMVAKAETNAMAKANMESYCQYARDVIWDAAKASRRFVITDFETAKQYDEELKGIFGAQMDDEKRAKLIESNANKIMASDWVIDASLTQVKVNIKELRGQGRAYSSQVILSITVKDREDADLKTVTSFKVETKEVPLNQQTYKLNRRDAVMNALAGLQRDLEFAFRANFPIRAKGLGMEEGLYKISAGTNQGLKENQELKIMHKAYDEANKKYVETAIGKCKVKKITPNSSLCELPKKIGEMMADYAVKPGIIYVTDK